MGLKLHRSTSRGLITFLILFCSLMAVPLATWAANDSVDTGSERIRQEMMKLLNEEGVLDEAIDRGIRRYIQNQQALARNQEQTRRSQKAVNVRPVAVGADHIRGDVDAQISLIEYSDFECPFCKRFHPTAKQLLALNKGKINWVYRHFPLEFHNPGAQRQAEASECAAELGGETAFWQYSDLIYERTTSNGNGFPIENLVPLAVEIGLDKGRFSSCLESNRMAERVKSDYENGVASGISGTPGNIFINNRTGQIYAAPGALPLDKLQAIVDRLQTVDSDVAK